MQAARTGGVQPRRAAALVGDHMIMRIRPVLLVLFSVLAIALTGSATASAQADEPEYTIVNPPLPALAIGGQPSTVLQGELGGAGYIIEVPPAWNGELVMWAHGCRGEGSVLTVDPPSFGMRRHLLERGYAWAASSYDANGYDIESGVRSTRELAKEFIGLVGKPERTYIGGVSMGGHITARSVEQYPTLYDGALPLCGVVGDIELFDFFLDYTLTSQALAGIDAYPIPTDWATGVVPIIKERLGIAAGPPNNELGEQFLAIVIEQSGGPRPGAEAAFEVWKDFLFSLPTPDDGLGLAFNPGRVATNVDTDYEPDAPVAIDEVVERVEAEDERARRARSLHEIAHVEGRQRDPVLSLHNLGDLFVPFSMEQYYALDAAANGRSDLLVQRAIRTAGHCEFSAAEITTAFDDLVRWVEDGVRPAGDDVLTPRVVADPSYGCRFTDEASYPTGSRGLFEPWP